MQGWVVSLTLIRGRVAVMLVAAGVTAEMAEAVEVGTEGVEIDRRTGLAG